MMNQFIFQYVENVMDVTAQGHYLPIRVMKIEHYPRLRESFLLQVVVSSLGKPVENRSAY